MDRFPGSIDFSAWDDPEKSDLDAKKAKEEARRAEKEAAEAKKAEEEARKQSEKDERTTKAAKESGVFDALLGLDESKKKTGDKARGDEEMSDESLEVRKRIVAQDIIQGRIAHLREQVANPSEDPKSQAQAQANLALVENLDEKLKDPEKAVEPEVERAYQETMASLTPEAITEYEANMAAGKTDSPESADTSKPPVMDEEINEPDIMADEEKLVEFDELSDEGALSEVAALNRSEKLRENEDTFQNGQDVDETPTIPASGTTNIGSPHSSVGSSGNSHNEQMSPPNSESGGGGYNTPPSASSGEAGNRYQPPQSTAWPSQPPRPPRNPNRGGINPNMLRRSGNTIAAAVVSGVIGIMIGEIHGRRAQKHHTERQINSLRTKLETKETLIREQARKLHEQRPAQSREKQIPPVSTERPIVRTPEKTNSQAEQSQVTRVAEVMDSKPQKTEYVYPLTAERPLAGTTSEVAARRLERRDLSRPGRLLVSHEVAPLPQQSKVKIEQLSTETLLKMARKIKIGSITVKRLYETNQIDRRGLITLVGESVRGGNLTRALEKVELGRERQYERAREFRHDDQGLQVASSTTSTSIASDNQFILPTSITSKAQALNHMHIASSDNSSKNLKQEKQIDKKSSANVPYPQPNLRTMSEAQAEATIKKWHSALLTIIVAAVLCITLIAVILLTQPWRQ